MNVYGRTHTGMVRKNNQDYFITKQYEGFCLFGVADGLGGHNAGEVASQTACMEIEKKVDELSERGYEFVKDALKEIIEEANLKVNNLAHEKEEYLNMGTTLCLGVASESRVCIYNIGDSRAYRIGSDIIQITKDHSLVQQLVDKGQLSQAEAETYPQKNVILRALGTEMTVEVDTFELKLNENEAILICSDGLTNNVVESDIYDQTISFPIDTATGELILKANLNGGTDNITVVIYRI